MSCTHSEVDKVPWLCREPLDFVVTKFQDLQAGHEGQLAYHAER